MIEKNKINLIYLFQHRHLPVQLDRCHRDIEACPADARLWIECLLDDEISHTSPDHGCGGQDPGEDTVPIAPDGWQEGHGEV